jgi:murein DD-endopeptidase MepM/ murein hydrolase activator NlpD
VGTLVIGNREFNVDANVIPWMVSGWDATAERCIPTPGFPDSFNCITAYGERAKNRGLRRYATRPRLRQFGKTPSYDAVKSVIRKFVLHHDGCFNAKMCWNVLHNERGLSCHFIIDNEGEIYQTLNLGLMGFHAAEFNVDSIGVEFCNRGDVLLDPNYYSKKGMHRDIKPCKINGHTIKSWDFTKKQYESFALLARDLTKLLPNIPLEYPQEPGSPGQQSWGTIDYGGAMGYAGYIGHYHLTNQKWDPGPFDIKTFVKSIRGKLSFPVYTKFDPKAPPPIEPPEIPENIDELRTTTKTLIDLNEQKADGGFFPVGPWGEQRLWHGGIHIPLQTGQQVYAAFPGRVLAARMGSESATGSNNFVLIRHDLSLGERAVRFWSLHMHLQDELTSGAKDKPPWLAKQTPIAGQTMLIDEPVEAGQLIGHVGAAGPEAVRRAQLHFEIFALEHLFDQLDGSRWEVVDGTGGGRFVDVDQVLTLIDTNSDRKLSGTEISTFYRGGGGQQFHMLATYHVSEWTTEPDWKDSLRSTDDFQGMKGTELDAMVDDQVVPGLWWTDDVALHAGLPTTGEVVHYHPLKFIAWYNEKILDADVAAAASGRNDVDEKQAVKTVAVGLTDDFGDVAGEHAMSESIDEEDPCDKQIDLADMVEGFDAKPKPGCEE